MESAERTGESNPTIKENLLLNKFFMGSLQQKITCHSCDNQSVKTEKFIDLNLPLDSLDSRQLQDLVTHNINLKETLSKVTKNEYYCSNCD